MEGQRELLRGRELLRKSANWREAVKCIYFGQDGEMEGDSVKIEKEGDNNK